MMNLKNFQWKTGPVKKKMNKTLVCGKIIGKTITSKMILTNN
ncbi:hypothetical protein NQ317_013580 [Molorchus minor]|uniref:Uncharacterized protein n=1 Tax=Molorchus minor TaxID=1323400 RepID=A0ABQ9IRA5_9CUCU|nr:hypothetical protein NQ317_013580 [Molorchus minor]